jgi:hypothetical protein
MVIKRTGGVAQGVGSEFVPQYCKNLKQELPCNPAIPLLCMYIKDYKPEYNKDTCTPMFTAVLQ